MTTLPSPDAPRPAAGHVPASADPLPQGDDRLAQVRAGVDDLGDSPLETHVPTLSRALDAIVGELDELARSIPPAR